MIVILLVGRLFAQSPSPSSPREFEAHFRDHLLRIEYEHHGDSKSQRVRILQLVKEPHLPLNPKALLDDRNLGAYRIELYELRDRRPGKLLYRRGYSSLFAEWRTTPKARYRTRTLQESIRVPMPRRESLLVLSSRDERNRFVEFFSARLDPSEAKSFEEIKALEPGEVRVLRESGPPQRCVDLLFLGDGFTESEKEKFFSAAEELTKELFEIEPFRSHRFQFNVRALATVSEESGVDRPREGVEVETALDTGFNALGIGRYLMTEADRKWRDAAAPAPYDFVCILANTMRYGGGGIYRHYCTVAVGDPAAEFVFVHELGHLIAGLADEYIDETSDFHQYYPLDREPWEPNVTRAESRARLKWRKLVEKRTPVPTPGGARFADVVGCFEGAGYRTRGLFRPEFRCLMKGPEVRTFCRVCEEALTAAIRLECR